MLPVGGNQTKNLKFKKKEKMNTKLSQTLSILLLVFYATCILVFKTGGILWFVYFGLLVSVFFWWEKKNIELPICLAGALPILEFVWVGIYSDGFNQSHFLGNLKTSSTFFDWGGFPGYVMWILVIPLAIYKLSHIWGKG